MLEGKVFVTGGAGFLGRALLHRAEVENWDCEFTVASRDDSKHAALQRRFPWVETVVADVGLTSIARLTDLMRGFDTVIHMAAWKYVDRGEHAARAVFQTNIIGSMNVAEAATRARVQRVVGISTDKATLPTNSYGLSKMAMERVFQESDRISPTAFTCVRYGNVVGSTGSVIPIWMDAAAHERPILLTDPLMTRFWMSPDEAVDTVLEGLNASGGTVTIPACRSMTMHDLALMALGIDEHQPLPTDGRVEIIGIRPGEKRHEALVQRQESLRATLGSRPGAPERWDWLRIGAPDGPVTNDTPFEVTSDQPPRGWIGPRDMRNLVAAAALV